jgi:hypothetical protein
MCNACNNYHMDMFERNIGGKHGGCNWSRSHEDMLPIDASHHLFAAPTGK